MLVLVRGCADWVECMSDASCVIRRRGFLACGTWCHHPARRSFGSGGGGREDTVLFRSLIGFGSGMYEGPVKALAVFCLLNPLGSCWRSGGISSYCACEAPGPVRPQPPKGFRITRTSLFAGRCCCHGEASCVGDLPVSVLALQ